MHLVDGYGDQRAGAARGDSGWLAGYLCPIARLYRTLTVREEIYDIDE
jgi:hypothetical protein